jgi:hypothetical protein
VDGLCPNCGIGGNVVLNRGRCILCGQVVIDPMIEDEEDDDDEDCGVESEVLRLKLLLGAYEALRGAGATAIASLVSGAMESACRLIQEAEMEGYSESKD